MNREQGEFGESKGLRIPLTFTLSKVGNAEGSEERSDAISLQCSNGGAGGHRRARMETGK